MGTEVAIAGLIISAASAGASYVQAEKRADLQEEAQAQQGAQQDVQAMEQRRQQIRQQKVRAAQIEQASATTGTSGSSGEAGAIGALSTNVLANIGIQSGQTRTARNITGISQDIADSNTTSALWNLAGQTGSGMFSTAMSNKETKKQFYSLFD